MTLQFNCMNCVFVRQQCFVRLNFQRDAMVENVQQSVLSLYRGNVHRVSQPSADFYSLRCASISNAKWPNDLIQNSIQKVKIGRSRQAALNAGWIRLTTYVRHKRRSVVMFRWQVWTVQSDALSRYESLRFDRPLTSYWRQRIYILRGKRSVPQIPASDAAASLAARWRINNETPPERKLDTKAVCLLPSRRLQRHLATRFLKTCLRTAADGVPGIASRGRQR